MLSAIGSALVSGAALGLGLGAAKGVSAKDRTVIAELQKTDREVRAHEAAHLAAAGGLARGVSFTYVTGPDGRQYAVGGEVSLDVSPESDPEATLRKAEQIRAAANAPANPSGQDRQVAAQAAQMALAAQQEIAERRREQQDGARAGSAAQYERTARDSDDQLRSTIAAVA